MWRRIILGRFWVSKPVQANETLAFPDDPFLRFVKMAIMHFILFLFFVFFLVIILLVFLLVFAIRIDFIGAFDFEVLLVFAP